MAWPEDGQPDAREGQAGRPGVAERPVIPVKLGNASGGKGPQFKTNARRKKGPGDWATYQLRKAFRNCRWRYTQKRRLKPAIASMPVTAHPLWRRINYAVSTELPARQVRMAAKALKPRIVPVSITEQIAA